MSLRPGTDAALQGAISADVIVSNYLFWLDFKSGPACLWTGYNSIQVVGSGDTALDGLTFDSIANGVMVALGDNSYSMQGSDPYQMSVAIPSDQTIAIASANVYPAEYQARRAIIWRCILVPSPDPLGAPAWLFRRVRAGAIDKIEFANDGTNHTFTLTIESHSALISNATNSTYLDQPRFDPADTSQAFAVSIANGGLSTGGASANYGGASAGGSAGGYQRYNAD